MNKQTVGLWCGAEFDDEIPPSSLEEAEKPDEEELDEEEEDEGDVEFG